MCDTYDGLVDTPSCHCWTCIRVGSNSKGVLDAGGGGNVVFGGGGK